MNTNTNKALTEKELLNNFEQYQKTLKELESLYGIPPIEGIERQEKPNYVSEATFSYQVHTST